MTYFYTVRNDHLPDLVNPVWLNEKIRWQFINHPNPLMTLAADKIAVRDYIQRKGARIPAPDLLLFGDDPAALRTAELPERFVLKTAHGNAQTFIQTGAAPRVTGEELANKVAAWWEVDHWRRHAELHYRGIPKRWLVEEFLPSTEQRLEYKVFCMMGEPAFIAAITERADGALSHALYDPDWKRVGFETRGIRSHPDPVPRPVDLDLILAEARRLSEDFLHVRVDFLMYDGRLAFSELTFTSLSANIPHEPAPVNAQLGALVDLDRAPQLLQRGRQMADELGWRMAGQGA